MYAWQAEALRAWVEARTRGVIEAVTGTGKTMVGIAAAMDTLEAGGKVQVVVPTIELLRQWTVELRRSMPGKRIGQLGDGKQSEWRSADIIVSVVNSARMYDLGRPSPGSLLIADECHRYGSAANARALDDRFPRRLGLSATYARSDEGNAEFLDPYFGDTCFRMDYRRAIADEVTAHFKVALVAVRFAPGEREAYDEANRVTYEAQRWLISGGHVREEPFGEFMKDVARLAQGEHGRATWKARSFLSNFTERRRILAESLAKRVHLTHLLPALAGADRSIVFTQTIEAAEDAVRVMKVGRLNAEAIHSRLAPEHRRRVLARFAQGQLHVIAAPQVLDEGVDVPAADLAVILAASRTQRQMIQRMGRVLRRKDDGRLARFVVLYVEGSSEDPAGGAHSDFLNEIVDVADEVANFKAGTATSTICAFLNDLTPAKPQGPPRMAGPIAGQRSAGANSATASSKASVVVSASPITSPAKTAPAQPRVARAATSKKKQSREVQAEDVSVSCVGARRSDRLRLAHGWQTYLADGDDAETAPSDLSEGWHGTEQATR